MYQIWFTAYNEGEMWGIEEFGRPLLARQVWSEYTDRQVMEEVGCTRLQVLSARDVRKSMHSPGNVLFDGDDGEHGDLFLVEFDNLEQARDIWRLWLKDLRSKEEHRGADDGTYDYYPDAWAVARQLAEGLRLKDEYNAAVKELRENTEYGEAGSELFDLIQEIS